MALAGGKKVPRQSFTNWQNLTLESLAAPRMHRLCTGAPDQPKCTGKKDCPWGIYQPKEQLLDPLNRALARPWLGLMTAPPLAFRHPKASGERLGVWPSIL